MIISRVYDPGKTFFIENIFQFHSTNMLSNQHSCIKLVLALCCSLHIVAMNKKKRLELIFAEKAASLLFIKNGFQS